MDTITHGIAGALIGKAVFRGEDMFASRAMNRGRIITWSLMLGAIFPDSDVFRDIFSHDKLLIVTWHRSITHSLVLLPLLALLLAWIYSQPERMWPRALRTWLVFLLAPLVISRIGQGAGAPISGRTVLGAMLTITAIFLLPTLRGWGLQVKYGAWNCAGFAATLI